MAQTCIYTLDPAEGGGVPAKMYEVVSLHRRFGHEPCLLYNGTSQLPTRRRETLNYLFHTRPQWVTEGDTPGLKLPYWPLPPWAIYLMPLLLARSMIAASQMHVAIAGSNHCGLTPAFLRKKFIVWIGTLYEEELQGKAAAGDRWAQRLLHSPAHSILAWEEKLIFERAALILTNGAHTARNTQAKFPRVADRVRVMLYPVDTALFRPEPARRAQVSCPYLLFTGRLNDPRKNMPLLFRAFALIRTHFPALKLRLTGDPPQPALLQSLAAAGVEDGVEFMGRQPRDALLNLYQGADLFVLPSLQEGLGISMLEALACGVPVVSTRCGGPESIITHGETGLLVENGNAEAFAAAALQLLAHPAELEAMRARCAAFAAATFSKPLIEQKLLAAFRAVYPEHFK